MPGVEGTLPISPMAAHPTDNLVRQIEPLSYSVESLLACGRLVVPVYQNSEVGVRSFDLLRGS